MRFPIRFTPFHFPLIAGVLVSTAASAFAIGTRASDFGAVSGIHYDASVPKSVRTQIEEDLRSLENFESEAGNPDPKFLTDGEVGPTPDERLGARLRKWLLARVKVIVWEDLKLSESTVVADDLGDSTYPFVNADPFSPDSVRIFPSDAADLLMSEYNRAMEVRACAERAKRSGSLRMSCPSAAGIRSGGSPPPGSSSSSRSFERNASVNPGDTESPNPLGDIVVARNLSSIYVSARDRGWLGALRLVDGGVVRFTSPRVGVIQVGSRLFGEIRSDDPVDRASARISRLTTLFHEARHGDGHGSNVAFPHSECPIGHAYAGKRYCDLQTNGAYAVDEQFTRLAIANSERVLRPEWFARYPKSLDADGRIVNFGNARKTLRLALELMRADTAAREFLHDGMEGRRQEFRRNAEDPRYASIRQAINAEYLLRVGNIGMDPSRLSTLRFFADDLRSFRDWLAEFPVERLFSVPHDPAPEWIGTSRTYR